MKRRHGFRFAPSLSVWQRHYNADAVHWVKVIVGLPTADATHMPAPITPESAESDAE